MSVPSLRLRVYYIYYIAIFFLVRMKTVCSKIIMIKIGPEAGYVTFLSSMISKVDSPPPIQSIAAPTIPTFPPIASVIHSGRTLYRVCTHPQ